MKTLYIVKTADGVNEHLLHSTMEKEFLTENYDEAKKTFEKEVKQLEKEYVNEKKLKYSPIEKEQLLAVYCSIAKKTIDDDGEEDIEFIEDSDYFYEK